MEILAIFFEVDIEYSRELHDLHSHLPFLRKKCNKLVCNLYDEKTMLSM